MDSTTATALYFSALAQNAATASASSCTSGPTFIPEWVAIALLVSLGVLAVFLVVMTVAMIRDFRSI